MWAVTATSELCDRGGSSRFGSAAYWPGNRLHTGRRRTMAVALVRRVWRVRRKGIEPSARGQKVPLAKFYSRNDNSTQHAVRVPCLCGSGGRGQVDQVDHGWPDSEACQNGKSENLQDAKDCFLACFDRRGQLAFAQFTVWEQVLLNIGCVSHVTSLSRERREKKVSRLTPT